MPPAKQILLALNAVSNGISVIQYTMHLPLEELFKLF